MSAVRETASPEGHEQLVTPFEAPCGRLSDRTGPKAYKPRVEYNWKSQIHRVNGDVLLETTPKSEPAPKLCPEQIKLLSVDTFYLVSMVAETGKL